MHPYIEAVSILSYNCVAQEWEGCR